MSDSEHLQEQIVARQSIYDGRLVKLDLLDIQLPNGTMGKRELITHPGAVAIVALDENLNVLLVRQFRMAAGRVMLEIPAGTLEPNELPEVCAERELQEEAGYKPHKLQSLGGIFVAPGYTTEYIHLFLATELSESRMDMDSDEFIEVEKIPLQDALERVRQGKIVDAKTITGLLKVAQQLGEL